MSNYKQMWRMGNPSALSPTKHTCIGGEETSSCSKIFVSSFPTTCMLCKIWHLASLSVGRRFDQHNYSESILTVRIDRLRNAIGVLDLTQPASEGRISTSADQSRRRLHRATALFVMYSVSSLPSTLSNSSPRTESEKPI